MTYQIIKSNRKTLAIQIKNGEVIVRAPFCVSVKAIESFLSSHEEWIERKLSEQKKAEAFDDYLSDEELSKLTEMAKEYIIPRVEYYSEIVGVKYGNIKIRHQKTRWGSCSSKGNLNFNCLLMLTPHEVIDCVIVHELCHLKEMNHSKRFYAEVLKAYPEYYKWNSILKENERSIMKRLK